MADTGTEPPGAAGPGASRSGPPRWIWWVAGLVMVAFVVAIALSGSSGGTTSTPSDAADPVPSAAGTRLGRAVLPALAGYRIVPPASGSEVLTPAEITGRAAGLPVPGAGAVVGRRRDFGSTSSDDVVRVVLLRMRTVADATRARRDLEQWWARQQGSVLDRVPIGATTAAVGTSRAADANGDHIQIAIGVTGWTVFAVLRFSTTAPTDTIALLTATTDQALRLRAP